MIVVGLTGKAGAGKGVVADHLVEAHGFTKLSFAGPLKKMLRTLDPIMDSTVYSLDQGCDCCEPSYGTEVVHLSELSDSEAELKAHYPEYRRLLQVLGTDCIRAVDEGFWVRAAMQQLTDPNGKYVFDDVRFPNEASAVYLRGKRPALWHVDRPGHDGGAGVHASEQHAGKMGENLTLTNDGTIEALHEAVDRAVLALAQEAV